MSWAYQNLKQDSRLLTITKTVSQITKDNTLPTPEGSPTNYHPLNSSVQLLQSVYCNYVKFHQCRFRQTAGRTDKVSGGIFSVFLAVWSKDFYTRSYPLHYFFILILEKEPVFPFSILSAKQANYWYHFYNVFGGDWTRDLPHSKASTLPLDYRGGGSVTW